MFESLKRGLLLEESRNISENSLALMCEAEDEDNLEEASVIEEDDKVNTGVDDAELEEILESIPEDDDVSDEILDEQLNFMDNFLDGKILSEGNIGEVENTAKEEVGASYMGEDLDIDC